MIEDRGIDEIYIDLTDVPGVHDALGHDRSAACARWRRRSRTACMRATGLTCSIGVTPNKLLSKIASELDKPDGLTLLDRRRHPGADLAAAGAQDQRHRPEGGAKLAALGIRHDRRPRRGRPRAGWSSTSARATAPGCTRRRTAATSAPVVTYSEPESISRETTFERDLHAVRDRAELGAHLHRAVRAAGRRPAAQGLRRRARSASSCASTTSRP